VNDTRVSAETTVESNLRIGDDVAVQFIFWTFHVERTDRRMVTNLFVADRYATQEALKSLTKDRVKRLLLSKLQCWLAQHKGHDEPHLFHFIINLASLFEEDWRITEAASISLEEGPIVEDIDWHGHVHDTFASNKIAAHLTHNPLEHIFLSVDDALVEKYEFTVFAYLPVAILKDKVTRADGDMFATFFCLYFECISMLERQFQLFLLIDYQIQVGLVEWV